MFLFRKRDQYVSGMLKTLRLLLLQQYVTDGRSHLHFLIILRAGLGIYLWTV